MRFWFLLGARPSILFFIFLVSIMVFNLDALLVVVIFCCCYFFLKFYLYISMQKLKVDFSGGDQDIGGTCSEESYSAAEHS